MVNCVKGLTRGENRWATIFMSQVGHEIGCLVASPFCWHGGWWHAQLAVRVWLKGAGSGLERERGFGLSSATDAGSWPVEE
jgi:hypothetical protein